MVTPSTARAYIMNTAQAHTKSEFEVALAAFILHLTLAKEEERKANFPNLPKTVYITEFGQKNCRIVSQDETGDNRYVFCFVRIADGAVLKAASWKAPAKHPRGSIFNGPTEYGVSTYGANYLR
jgi:hypothetical protein